jgi:hypothetical protein
MAAAGELVAGASANGQHSADDKGNDAEHPDDREPGYEADDQQYDPENNHGLFLPSFVVVEW